MRTQQAQTRPAVRSVVFALVALVAALALSACGSSSSSNSTSTPAPADTGAKSSEPASFVADAQKLIDAAKPALTYADPGPALDAKKLKGKAVLVVGVDMRIPAIASTAKAAQEAAKAAGLSPRLVDTASDPSKMLKAVQEGVRTANAIVLVGVSQDLVVEPLKKAEAAKIPVVSAIVSEPLPDEPGQGAGPTIYANSSQSNVEAGKLMAARAVVDTQGKANVAIFTTKEITANKFVVEGIKSVLDTCTTCKIVAEEDTPLGQWSTGLTSKAASVVRRDPSINYILPIFDAMGLFVVPGVQGASSDVKVASFNGTPAALKLVQAGGKFTADPGQPYGWAGWEAIDQSLRGMLGMKPGNPKIPVRYFDKESLQGVNVDDEDALYGNPTYREGLKKLWGLG